MNALERLAKIAEEAAIIAIDGHDGYETAEVTNWPEVVLAILNSLGTQGREMIPLDANREPRQS